MYVYIHMINEFSTKSFVLYSIEQHVKGVSTVSFPLNNSYHVPDKILVEIFGDKKGKVSGLIDSQPAFLFDLCLFECQKN